MKKFILILTGCALALSPVGAEEEKKPASEKPGAKAGEKAKGKGGDKGKGNRKGKGKGDGSFLAQIDKDGDKAISKEEAGERWERMKALDKDSDGKVTMQELAAGRGGAGPRFGGKGAPKGGPEMFKRSDKNGDGKLTKDEVPEQAWTFLSRLDKNGDDAISEEEAKAGRPPGSPGSSDGGPGKGRSDEMWKRADKNSDGKITKDEVPEQAWDRLGKLDKNGDNAVNREEMAAGMAAMRGGKGKGKGGPQGGPQGGPGAVFERFDKDKDGKIAESEVPAEMWSKLRRADSDADGLVSKPELAKVYEGRAGAGGPPKGGPAKGKDGPAKGGPAKGDTPPSPKKKRPELESPDA